METQAQEYFNLHLNGVGYLSRVRWVEPGGRHGGRRAERFLSCAINALHGDVEAVNYTYFDLKVSGHEAIDVVQSLQAATEQNRKVLVAFRAADIYPHMYDRRVRVDGEPTDGFETATLIKGRLILVYSAKVDGELVFKRETVVEAGGAPLESGTAGAQPVEAVVSRDTVEDERGAESPAGPSRGLPSRGVSGVRAQLRHADAV